MHIFKSVFFILLFTISISILGSCSSSKKMKKKCLDCPEFSLQKDQKVESYPLNENI